jgi:hypothetical protein
MTNFRTFAPPKMPIRANNHPLQSDDQCEDNQMADAASVRTRGYVTVLRHKALAKSFSFGFAFNYGLSSTYPAKTGQIAYPPRNNPA